MIIRQILLLQIWRTFASSNWYLQPTMNIERNGTLSTKIFCQTKSRASQITWFFKPIGDDSYWKTVKAFPEQSHVTTYDRYTRYSVKERLNTIDGRLIYEYDLHISPVHWSDRGVWKCEVESNRGVSIQSIEGLLDVEVPLEEVYVQSDENSGALVVDENNEVKIVCQTSPSTPAPSSLTMFIGTEALKNVQVQTSMLENNMMRMIGTVKISKIPRNYNDQVVRCVSHWNGRDKSNKLTKEGRARLNVFFPPSHIRIDTRPVKWNELLVAKCDQGIKGNPTPQFEWRLNGRALGTGPTIETKVTKEDDLKTLECVAVHTTFQDAKEIRIRTDRQIRVEYPPEAYSLKFIQTANHGDFQTFKCISSVSNPSSELQIEADDNVDLQIGPLQTTKKSGGYIASRIIKIPRLEKLHNHEIRCVESWYDFETSYFRQDVKKRLKIEHAPGDATITFNDNTAPVAVGVNKVKCNIIGGYPSVTSDQVNILVDGQVIKKAIVIDSENNFAAAEVTFTKQDHNKNIECVISHPRLSQPLTSKQTVQVGYDPTTVSINLDAVEYKAGDIVNYTVLTDAAYPSAAISCVKKLFNGSITEMKSENETFIPVQPYGSITQNEFSFRTSNLDDDAQIECSIAGQPILASKRISVLTEPIFLENKIFTIKEGETFKLNLDMIIRSNPPVNDFQWRRVQPKSTRLTIREENAKRFLILEKVTSEMAGEYFVESEGISGSIKLNVLTVPQLFITGEKKYLLGEQLYLSCKSSGEPEPTVYWKKGDIQISNSSDVKITNVSRENAGEYYCFGQNTHSLVEQKMAVEVLYEPILKSSLNRIVVFKDDYQVTLACEVDSYPPIDSMLFVNPLGSENVGIWNGEIWTYTIDVGIKSATFGSWSCRAENTVGKTEFIIDVVEAGKPDKVAFIRLTNQTQNGIVLRWKKGYDNGFSQNFRVQLQSSTEVRKFSTFSEHIRLANLTDTENYVATVVAVNDHGISIPAEINFNIKGIENASVPTVYIYLICFTILTLAIIITVVICNRKRELIYQTKKLESDTDRSSLPESEMLVKANHKTSNENYDYEIANISDPILESRDQAILRFYSLGADKRTEPLESTHLYNFNGNPDQLDYQPNLPHDSLCQRHQSQRTYPTLPNKLIDTTSGYCSSNSSSSQAHVKRSQSFQQRKRNPRSEGVLV